MMCVGYSQPIHRVQHGVFLFYNHFFLLLVVAKPSGYTDRVQIDDKFMWMSEEELEPTSSTLIRERLAAGETITDLTYDSVSSYMEEHGIADQYR